MQKNATYSFSDIFVASLAREIEDGEIVFSGIASALPTLAIYVAKTLYAPHATYLNCAGAVDPEVREISCSSVDISFLEKKNSFLSLHEIWDLAAQSCIDVLFLGAAQIDCSANSNTTCIGEYQHPQVKLPGVAGASLLRKLCKKVIFFLPNHSKRVFVEKVDFITSTPAAVNQKTKIISNLGIFSLENGELELTALNPGVREEDVLEHTGFQVKFSSTLCSNPAPSLLELKAMNAFDPQGTCRKLIR